MYMAEVPVDHDNRRSFNQHTKLTEGLSVHRIHICREPGRPKPESRVHKRRNSVWAEPALLFCSGPVVPYCHLIPTELRGTSAIFLGHEHQQRYAYRAAKEPGSTPDRDPQRRERPVLLDVLQCAVQPGRSAGAFRGHEAVACFE